MRPLPRPGDWIEAPAALVASLRRLIDSGRRIRPNTISGYLTLAFVASLGAHRRGSLRHGRERAHREAWLESRRGACRHYDLGVEVLACRRLVKGYSDTHARGLSKFDRVMGGGAALARRGRRWLDRLIRAALADEKGVALDGVLKTRHALGGGTLACRRSLRPGRFGP